MAEAPGFMDSLSSFFRPSKPTGNSQGGNPNTQVNTTTGQPPAKGTNPNNPTDPNAPGAGNPNPNDPANMQNPLDVYADLFDNNKLNAGAPQAPEFKLSPDIVSKAASSLDFTAGLPQDLASKIQQGQALEVNDYMQLMNHVGRQAYARSIEHLSHLTGKFVDQRSQYERQGLPKELQRLLANNKVAANPAASKNPVVRAHLELISSSLAAKYPDQTPEWIAEAHPIRL